MGKFEKQPVSVFLREVLKQELGENPAKRMHLLKIPRLIKPGFLVKLPHLIAITYQE